MRQRLIQLTTRRIYLLARAQDERAHLVAALAPADSLAAMAGRMGRLLEWAANRPLLSGAAVALLVWRKPRFALSWLGRGLALARLYLELRRRFAATGKAAPGFQR